MNRLFLAAGLILLAGGVVRGDPPPGVKVIRVQLHPVATPSPALRYPLLPELRNQKSGNAVPHFRAAVKAVKEAIAFQTDNSVYELLERWREMPLERLPRERIRAFFKSIEPALRLVEEASRYEYADWELTEKLRKMGIGTLLPDVQEMRQFAALFSVRARLALADGRIDDAVWDLQTIMAVARHTGHAPVLICDLVAIAVAQVALAQIDDFIQQPNAPNLYWSLTDLPATFVDLRFGMQGERVSIYASFPNIPLTPAEASKTMLKKDVEIAFRQIAELQADDFIPPAVYKINMALDLQRKHERAKQALVEAGWPRAALEKMPHIQVGMLHGFLDYDRTLDEMMKGINLPFWQSAPALMEIEKKRRTFHGIPRPDQPAIPLGTYLVPATSRILFARTRLERRIAVLRCLEALRLYAAAHDGKLPANLNDVKEVPIPVDPFSGKSFEYKLTDDKATLFAPAIALPVPGRRPLPQDSLYYEITIKR